MPNFLYCHKKLSERKVNFGNKCSFSSVTSSQLPKLAYTAESGKMERCLGKRQQWGVAKLEEQRGESGRCKVAGERGQEGVVGR